MSRKPKGKTQSSNTKPSNTATAPEKKPSITPYSTARKREVFDLDGIRDILFTPTEEEMMVKLYPGEPVTRAELMKCLYNDQAVTQNLNPHITNIRNKIRPVGYTVLISFLGGKPRFQLVKLINHASPEEEKS